MWTVPWSLDTQMREASWLKLMLEEAERMEGIRNLQTGSLTMT